MIETRMAHRIVDAAQSPSGVTRPRLVLVVDRDWASVPVTLGQLLDAARDIGVEVERVKRVNGDQSIQFTGGGRIVFTTPRSTPRFAVDVIVLDPSCFGHPEFLVNLAPTIATATRPEVWTLPGPMPLAALGTLAGG